MILWLLQQKLPKLLEILDIFIFFKLLISYVLCMPALLCNTLYYYIIYYIVLLLIFIYSKARCYFVTIF